MNKDQALALYDAYMLSTGQRSVATRLSRFVRLQAKDKRLSQLKAYLNSLSDPAQSITNENFRLFIILNYPRDIGLYDALENPSMPCSELFLALAQTALAKRESKTIVIEPSPSTPKLFVAEADLDEFPGALVDVRSAPNSKAQLNIGDLHGNAIKLIYFLIREKVLIGLDKEDYARLVAIYKTPVDELSEEQLNEFKEILIKAEAHADRSSLVRLIGDILCDRANNDAFTLFVLKHLARLSIAVEVEASNHDVEFIRACKLNEAGVLEFQKTHLAEDQDRSMLNMQKLLNKFPKLNAELAEIIEKQYLPSVKLLSYVLGADGKTITLCTHAPVGLETMKALALHFKVDFNDASIHTLKKTIDDINTAVVASGGIAEIYNILKSPEDLSDPAARVAMLAHSLYKIIWNREYASLDRPHAHGDAATPYFIAWLHGHDHSVPFPDKPHVINLDDELGKGVSNNQGSYQLAYSDFLDPHSFSLGHTTPSRPIPRHSKFSDLGLGISSSPLRGNSPEDPRASPPRTRLSVSSDPGDALPPFDLNGLDSAPKIKVI